MKIKTPMPKVHVKMKTHQEFCQIMSLKTGLKDKTIKRVYDVLLDYITDELKINGQVRLRGLGVLRLEERGSYIKPMPDKITGKMVDRFINAKMLPKFRPTETFVENLNLPLGESTAKNKMKHKKGTLIEAGSELKWQREQLVKNLIAEEMFKRDSMEDMSDDEFNIDELLEGLEQED